MKSFIVSHITTKYMYLCVNFKVQCVWCIYFLHVHVVVVIVLIRVLLYLSVNEIGVGLELRKLVLTYTVHCTCSHSIWRLLSATTTTG